MVTIYDVAKKAGVSATTVSHVVNGTRTVAPTTEKKVRDAIRTLKYRPNVLARSLRQSRSNVIGLLLPDCRNPFYAELARSIEERAYKSGYSVMICNSSYNQDREREYVETLANGRVDGLIVAPLRSKSETIDACRDRGLPTVVVDRISDSVLVDQVVINNEYAGAQAAKYLLKLGHRQIGCITYLENWTATADRRLEGFRRTLNEAGVDLPDDAVVYSDFQFLGGQAAMEELLTKGPILTAVFACNDLMAAGALIALRRAGFRVPDDISVLGFDNSIEAVITSPALTTFSQPIADLCGASVNQLLQLMNGETNRPRRHVFNAPLVERESCAPPPSNTKPRGKAGVAVMDSKG